MTNVINADKPHRITFDELNRGDMFSYSDDRRDVFMVVSIDDAERIVNLAEGSVHTCQNTSAHVFPVRRVLLESEMS